MMGYTWSMPIHNVLGAPVTIARGERVELVMQNDTMMAHPMHLHGHSFQVTEINDRKLAGAIRDSVLVPPRTTVKVVFDPARVNYTELRLEDFTSASELLDIAKDVGFQLGHGHPRLIAAPRLRRRHR